MKIKFLTIVAVLAFAFSACKPGPGPKPGPKPAVFTVYSNATGSKVDVKDTPNVEVTYTEEGKLKFKAYLKNNTDEDIVIKVKATRETPADEVDEFCGTEMCQMSNGEATQVFDFGTVRAETEEFFYSTLTPKNPEVSGNYVVKYEFYEEGKEGVKVVANCTFKYTKPE